MNQHSFVVCAYGESPYLEKCIQSLLAQEEKTHILMCTSTPNDYLETMAAKYGIPILVNPEKGDIQSDWNYAYRACNSRYVTLAHQDDVYDREYTRRLFRAMKKHDDISIFYSNYRSLITRGEQEDARKDVNCRLRNALCLPMRVPFLQTKKLWKRLTLRLGNSICCSSVTYHKELLGREDLFRSEMRFALDWDTFFDLAGREGRFYYDRKVLAFFRIHLQSTSMLCIENSLRVKEDQLMFEKMWPRPIASLIMKFYRLAYRNYENLKEEGLDPDEKGNDPAKERPGQKGQETGSAEAGAGRKDQGADSGSEGRS